MKVKRSEKKSPQKEGFRILLNFSEVILQSVGESNPCYQDENLAS